MITLAAAHTTPGGIITWTLAIATLAGMVALAYGLRALRSPRSEQPPEPTQTPVTGHVVAHPRSDKTHQGEEQQ